MIPFKQYFKQYEMLDTALSMASTGHKSQYRKITNESYILHPVNVANIVFSVTDNAYIIAAALLHDTVEDCGITYYTIRYTFCTDVADWVQQVTNVSTKSDGTREKRAKMELDHLGTICDAARIIKLADIIDNTRSIPLLDPKFAKIYMAEKRQQIDVLHMEGDREITDNKAIIKLHNIANKINDNYWNMVA